MNRCAKQQRDAGFTLVEVLVSLALFSAVGLAGFTTLDTIIRVQTQTELRLEHLNKIDLAMLLVTRDLQKMEPGSLELDGTTVTFQNVSGVRNQRLSYQWDEGKLIRQLDQVSGFRQTILSNLSALEWQLLRPGDNQEKEPDAVSLGLTLSDGRKVNRLIILPQTQR